VTIFERIVPFPQRLQWLMLKMALETGMTASAFARRMDWSIEKVRQHIWGAPGKIRIGNVGEWFFACAGQIPQFEIVHDP
jgi:hypothetical protein